MISDKPLLFDDPDVIQELLCSSYCECRDDHIAASVKGFLDGISKLSYIVRLLSMQSVAVSGFTYDVVRMRRILR